MRAKSTQTSIICKRSNTGHDKEHPSYNVLCYYVKIKYKKTPIRHYVQIVI